MNISRASAEELRELLLDLQEYMDQRADISEKYEYGDPIPNTEMKLLVRINEAVDYLRFPDDPF